MSSFLQIKRERMMQMQKTEKRQEVDYAAELKLRECQINLSDFALFLSVMKNKEAHENVLSIILGEPNLKLKKVHTEEVVLNKIGKRAIRLDAWALSEDDRQFATEMQNDTSSDDMRKRSRFYQGLLDTPILKSGKRTRYQELPSTIVTFITQEDIFQKGRAKYTFTERCIECPELELDDGTTKIFLNMASKNGDPGLVSLLQYMKDTRSDNPEILCWDERLTKIDNVVNEVKQSEEWEVVQMSILSIGLERGQEIGEERGRELGELSATIRLIVKKLKKDVTPVQIAELLEMDLSEVQKICAIAKHYAPGYDIQKICEEYWKSGKNEN